ncbi:hypothetical protein NBZ79_04625 [Sneathiella marina]|uniref:Uncharacterized protein n=1 Tax=Sneathiella marina TaxID=2950108 RepID=A0ABY4WC87_9PROT|nr:hypothetical protein [Sneathiella marina]USG62261.1 hypothetical protein NBZ79_04625 [Sneathiella marina]
MIEELLGYVINKTGNRRPDKDYIKSHEWKDLVGGARFRITDKCVHFLFGELVGNEGNRTQFNDILQQAYDVFKENTRNANEEEIQDLFFEEITKPYLKYIEDFADNVFTSSTIEKYLENQKSEKVRPYRATASIFVIILIIFLVVMVTLLIKGATENRIKDTVGTLILMGVLALLCGLGGAGILYYGYNRMRPGLQQFVDSKELINAVIRNPQGWIWNAQNTSAIDLEQLLCDDLKIDSLASIVLGQIKWHSVLRCLLNNSLLSKEISMLIIEFVFDERTALNKTGLLEAQHIYLEAFVPAETPLFTIESGSKLEKPDDEKTSFSRLSKTSENSLTIPLLTATPMSAGTGGNQQPYTDMLLIDLKD